MLLTGITETRKALVDHSLQLGGRDIVRPHVQGYDFISEIREAQLTHLHSTILSASAGGEYHCNGMSRH